VTDNELENGVRNTIGEKCSALGKRKRGGAQDSKQGGRDKGGGCQPCSRKKGSVKEYFGCPVEKRGGTLLSAEKR